MKLPFEIIHIIYNYSDIDTKQSFHKLFSHNSFLKNKLTLDPPHLLMLDQMISFKHTNYIVLKQLSTQFSFLNSN